MVDKGTIDKVLKRFLGSPRQPAYLNVREYKNNPNLLETNIEIYMSSAWYTSHWSYDKSKAYTVNLLGGREGYFVCALPYQMSIKEGLKKRIEIEDEMSESDFDEITFNMEMGCMPIGDNGTSFFKFDDISQCRKLQTAIYPLHINKKNIPNVVENEKRILSVDVALMASKKHKNDASSIIINSAIPTSGNKYVANIIYLENYEGLKTEQLALIVRRLFKQYKCTDLVIDTNGLGIGVYDCLIRDMMDYETGEIYPALSCCNDKFMADRCDVDNAPKVIWSIKASPQFNSEICVLLRSGFQNGKINLLVSEFEAEEILKEKIKGYDGMSDGQKMDYKMPFIQTTLLLYELISLESEVRGTNIRIIEKSGKRKDRYSSLAYNYWVMCQLERDSVKNRNSTTMQDYAAQLSKLNKRPNFY